MQIHDSSSLLKKKVHIANVQVTMMITANQEVAAGIQQQILLVQIAKLI